MRSRIVSVRTSAVFLSCLMVVGAWPVALGLAPMIGVPSEKLDMAEAPVSVGGLAPSVDLLGSPEPRADGTVRAIATFAEGWVPAEGAFEAWGLSEIYRFVSIPAVGVAGPQDGLDGFVAEAPGLVSVEYDRELQFFLDTATFATRAVDVWSDTWWPGPAPAAEPILLPDGTPVDGRGVTVGVVDSGINAMHPDLWYAPAHVDGMPWGPKVLECVKPVPLTNVVVPNAYCDESVGHGTHVAGIVAGTGWAVRNGLTPLQPSSLPYVGAAPGASLVGAGTGAGIFVLDAGAGLDWMYANAQTYGIRVVTNSWGDQPGCSTSFPGGSIITITNRLVEDHDIVVLFAAGNYDTISNPTTVLPTWTSTYSRNPTPGVISVANYNERNEGTRSGVVAGTSSDGCTGATTSADLVWTWPDVAAPGTAIVSTASYTGTAPFPNWDPPFYASASGTSMATPHVAGIAALIRQANPSLTAAEVERIIVSSTTPWDDSVAARGKAGPVHWGANRDAEAGFTDPASCAVSASTVAGYPRMTDLAATFGDAYLDQFVCRDFKRGNGLVDAYAAVQMAMGGGATGQPALTIVSPAPDSAVSPGLVTFEGTVDRLGGSGHGPLTADAGGPYSGGPGAAIPVAGTAAGGASASGFTCAWTGAGAAFADAAACATSVTFAEMGEYEIVLTVDDGSGTAQDVAAVVVAPEPEGGVLYFTEDYARVGPNFVDCGQVYRYATTPLAPPPGKAYSGQAAAALSCATEFAGTTEVASDLADGVVVDLWWSCDEPTLAAPSFAVPGAGSLGRVRVALTDGAGTTYASGSYVESDATSMVCDDTVRHTPVSMAGEGVLPAGSPVVVQVNVFVLTGDPEGSWAMAENLHVLVGGDTASALYLDATKFPSEGGASTTASSGPFPMHRGLIGSAVKAVGFADPAGIVDLSLETASGASSARQGPPAPAPSDGLGPGTPILTYANGFVGVCTANYVWQDQSGGYHLGAAGHCFFLGDDDSKVATHGPDADLTDTSHIRVDACVARCAFGGASLLADAAFLGGTVNEVVGDLVTLGTVAYARQGPQVYGQDFGLVRIPNALEHLIRPEMPVWNGPVGVWTPPTTDAGILGNPTFVYGNGIVLGDTFATKARMGTWSFEVSDYPGAWVSNTPASQGDSGSAVNFGARIDASEVVQSRDAMGIVTHIFGFPITAGTTVQKAVDMAAEAGLEVDFLREGATLGGGGGEASPEAWFAHQLGCSQGTRWMDQVDSPGDNTDACFLVAAAGETLGLGLLGAFPATESTRGANAGDTVTATVFVTYDETPTSVSTVTSVLKADGVEVGRGSHQQVVDPLTWFQFGWVEYRMTFELVAGFDGAAGLTWEVYHEGSARAMMGFEDDHASHMVVMSTVESANAPPVADAGADVTVTEHDDVSLSGSCSDPDGDLASCTWSQVSGPEVGITDHGDGTASFTAPDVDRDVVLVLRLTATDAEGASHSDEVSVTVLAVGGGQERVEIWIDGAHVGPYAPVGPTGPADPAAAWSVEVDLAPFSGGPVVVVARWLAADGGLIASAEAGFIVTEPPTVELGGPQKVQVGREARYTADATDPDGSIVAYAWEFGDGTTRDAGRQVTYAWSEPGDYTVRVTVTDDAGATATATRQVEVW